MAALQSRHIGRVHCQNCPICLTDDWKLSRCLQSRKCICAALVASNSYVTGWAASGLCFGMIGCHVISDPLKDAEQWQVLTPLR